jgi:polyisoprenyl-phosphate glycosyltransferase
MKRTKPLISIVTPCFNEEENVNELYRRVCAEMSRLPEYDFEHIYIDNASTDDTCLLIKQLAAQDGRVKLIVNNRNFGHIRSPLHAYLQSSGDAVIAMVADLQDPPELIPQFIAKWAEGYKVVVGVKPASKEGPLMALTRRLYYRTIGRISDVELIPNFHGFGIYDREVIEQIRNIDDPYPYFRGLISEFGYKHASIPFTQPRRARGITKNNFYSLYDTAMLGLTSHSKIPIRLATIFGFTLSGLSMIVALTYFVAKLLFWNSFSMGTAPVLIGMFFFASVQLFFIGILGEYIASIHTHIMKRPLVIEKERVNFDAPIRASAPLAAKINE